jgi:hypothetical protein
MGSGPFSKAFENLELGPAPRVALDVVVVVRHIDAAPATVALDVVLARQVFLPMAFGVVLLLGLKPLALFRHVDPFPLGDLRVSRL